MPQGKSFPGKLNEGKFSTSIEAAMNESNKILSIKRPRGRPRKIVQVKNEKVEESVSKPEKV